jgi:hypothetical protein
MALGTFLGLPLATIQSLKASYLDCLAALAQNQSYTLGGRNITRADLKAVNDTIAELQYAENRALGRGARKVLCDFSNNRL